jgi:DNA-binding protein HU-beta
MTKADVVDDIAREVGILKTQAERAVEVLLAAIKGHLAHGGRIELRGFGVLDVRPRKLGIGRNPRTGVVVKLRAGRKVHFKAGKDLTEAAAALLHRGLGGGAKDVRGL